MKDAPYVPANFRISRSAQAKLIELTQISSRSGGREMVPALFLHHEYDEGRQGERRGFGWGWYYRDEVPPRLLQEIDGISLVFGVEPKHASHFNGRLLDYSDDRRFFLAE